MNIWAIGDLHLSFGVADKTMDLFGPQWVSHAKKIQDDWEKRVKDTDLVLIPGDISWGMRMEEALPDLEWIDALPGKKIMIRGNHDYWWGSIGRVRKSLPPSIQAIQNDSVRVGNVEIGGTRLWDGTFSFNKYIDLIDNPKEKKELRDPEEIERERKKIFEKELHRLELSLKSFKEKETIKIVMVHYPPVDAEMNPSPVSDLLEKYGVSLCIFGHLHNVKAGSLPFGTARGVQYFLTSCDYTNFKLVNLNEIFLGDFLR